MIESSILRIIRNGHILGTGFLVANNLAVTCAHVVAEAGETIQVQFTGRDEILLGRVISEYYRDPDNGDIAFIRLESVPESITLLRLGAAEHNLSGSPFQAFGFPTVGEIEGIHVRGEILGLVAENGQRLLQLRSIELNQGHSGAPVWDERRSVVVGMVVSVYKSDASGKLRDTAFAVPSETLWQVCPEIRPSETPPYLGLETFTDETAQFFFGREALIEKLLNILRGGCRFLAVFGPSGSGKSSVVRAGLLPALKKGKLPGSLKWTQIRMRPAYNPFEQMKAEGLDPVDINGYLKSHADAERIVLFIDQFEELFTLCPDNLQERFVHDLATALENSKLLLIVSMRDDFYSTFNAQAALLAGSEHLKIENVPGNLKRDELVAMIERPAAAVGLALEEGLTELITKDLTRDGEARSSTLPLLEFALTLLWEKRREGRLTHEAYQSIGGVTGSLAQWAENAYFDSDLTEEERPMVRRILTNLVYLGREDEGISDACRIRPLSEIAHSEAENHVLAHLSSNKYRLVAAGDMLHGQQSVQIIHEALLHEWTRLKNWLAQDRTFLLWQQDFAHWREKNIWLDEAKLQEADHWLAVHPEEFTPSDHQYIQSNRKRLSDSIQRIRREKYLRQGIVLAATMTVVGLLVWAAWTWRPWIWLAPIHPGPPALMPALQIYAHGLDAGMISRFGDGFPQEDLHWVNWDGIAPVPEQAMEIRLTQPTQDTYWLEINLPRTPAYRMDFLPEVRQFEETGLSLDQATLLIQSGAAYSLGDYRKVSQIQGSAPLDGSSLALRAQAYIYLDELGLSQENYRTAIDLYQRTKREIADLQMGLALTYWRPRLRTTELYADCSAAWPLYEQAIYTKPEKSNWQFIEELARIYCGEQIFEPALVDDDPDTRALRALEYSLWLMDNDSADLELIESSLQEAATRVNQANFVLNEFYLWYVKKPVCTAAAQTLRAYKQNAVTQIEQANVRQRALQAWPSCLPEQMLWGSQPK